MTVSDIAAVAVDGRGRRVWIAGGRADKAGRELAWQPAAGGPAPPRGRTQAINAVHRRIATAQVGALRPGIAATVPRLGANGCRSFRTG